MGTPQGSVGFGPVLRNRHFRALWLAQVLGNTASYGMNLILLVLVQFLTSSTLGTAGVVMAYTIPGVLFSPVAGVVVDRWSKKAVLFWSNALRVITLLVFVLILYTTGLKSTWSLIGIYFVAFMASGIGQFFGPAEAAAIPLLVPAEQLLPANSLFGITLTVSQVVGLVVFGPAAVKLLGYEMSFVLLAVAFGLAAISIGQLPSSRFRKPRTAAVEATPPAGWGPAVRELREGWHFVVRRRNIYIPLAHFALIATLLSILQAMGPGFTERVLGMKPEDSVIIFAPAGVGMVIASFLLGSFGYKVSRRLLAHVCLVLGGISLWLISLVSGDYNAVHILRLYPERFLTLTSAIVVICTFFGLSVSVVNILASTNLQQYSPNFIRGRVFAVQFMLNNLLSIPPLLLATALAEQLGIPTVFGYVGVAMLVFAVLSLIATYRPWTQQERDLQATDQKLIDAELQALFSPPGEVGFSSDGYELTTSPERKALRDKR